MRYPLRQELLIFPVLFNELIFKDGYFEDAIIQVPINYGSASIFGFDNSINLNLVEGKVILGTYFNLKLDR